MIDKRYANDHVKSKSRDLIRTSIEETVLIYKRPEEVKVLCLPGVDAQEIFEIYDQLNIPRANIAGIEIEDEEFRELQGKDLGIELYHGDISDYVDSQERLELDVVSLDYDGYLTEENLSVLQKIKNKQTLNSFLLHHANSARREKEISKNLYSYESSYTKYLSSMLNIPELLGNPNEGSKEKSYTNLITENFISHIDEVKNLRKTLKFILRKGYKEFMQNLMEKWEWDLVNGGEREFLEGVSRTPIFSAAFEVEIAQAIGKIFSDEWGVVNTGDQGFVYLQMFSSLKNHSRGETFSPTNYLRRYKYISESSCPMIGDINIMERDMEFNRKSSNLVKSLGFPRELKIKKFRDIKKIRKASIALIKYAQKVKQFDISAELYKYRIDLGSSSKPVLTKKRFLQELDGGTSMEEMREKYRGWKNKPLAQWKAHHTMGTYDRKDNQVISLNGNEELSKEDAIDLIQSGIPITEILESYPDSFTKGQLRAFKAHHTMGTYNV